MRSAENAELDAAYRYCRQLNARHGKTFYLATGLLPKPARRHVHALYGFARYADDIVDQPGADPVGRLADLTGELQRALAGAPAANPVVRAVTHTVAEYRIEHSYLTDFLASMAADLTVTRYRTFAELAGYMWGSASVIGLQLLPILGVASVDRLRAEQGAAELGNAFQLTNFLRDVGEDYRRGRIYLPQESLDEHGVIETMFSLERTTPQLRALLVAEIERTRGHYRRAEPAIALLDPTAQDCVRTAFVLYGEILDEIERAGYEVLTGRVRVPLRRRLQVGGAGYLRAVQARRGGHR